MCDDKLTTSRAGDNETGNTGIGRWPCHGPAKLREQPDGGLLDKLVFGVGVGHGESVVAVFCLEFDFSHFLGGEFFWHLRRHDFLCPVKP